MAWAASLLAGTGGQVVAALAIVGVLALYSWFLIRVGERRGLAKARGSDLEIRGTAEKASHAGYAGEKQRLEQMDPVTDAPLGGPGSGGLRPGDPGGGAARHHGL